MDNLEIIHTDSFPSGPCEEFCSIALSEFGRFQCEDCLSIFSFLAVRQELIAKHKLYNPTVWVEAWKAEYALLRQALKLYRTNPFRLMLRRYYYFNAETLENSRAFYYV